MPSRPKRTFQTAEERAAEFEEEDSDYDNAPSGGTGRRRTVKGRQTPKRRRRRNSNDFLEESGDSDELTSVHSTDGEKERAPVMVNENGRPMRRAAQSRVVYRESDSNDEEEKAVSPRDSQDEDERELVAQKTVPTSPKRRTKKIILKMNMPKLKTESMPETGRRLRSRDGSRSAVETTAVTAMTGQRTRRSSRLSHDEEEPLIGLTNSGNHAEVIRAGSKEPEVTRPSRAVKSIKYPSKSTIEEVSQENSNNAEVGASQQEIAESDPQTQDNPADDLPRIMSDIHDAAEMEDAVIADSQEVVKPSENHEVDDYDDESDPISRPKTTRSKKQNDPLPALPSPTGESRLRGRTTRQQDKQRAARSSQRKAAEGTSDFEPDDEPNPDDELSSSPAPHSRPATATGDSSNSQSRSLRPRRGGRATAEEQEEIQDELADLKEKRSRKRKHSESGILYEPRKTRTPRNKVDYRVLRPELNTAVEEAEENFTGSQAKRRPGGGNGNGGWKRTALFSTFGPFGGGGPKSVFGGPAGQGTVGGVEPDSSEDEASSIPKPIGGVSAKTPTSAAAPNLFPPTTPHGGETAGTPANLGRIKDKQALADADPLGVDQHVTFDGVGGLQGHIDQLKEMVMLPLLYPEIFLQYKLTPPRGVLFHGPPGTGKTLLARALATSVSSEGKKVTFYMRKGADALSKWVGEAEKQLRMLFEEARRTQPSIIFFDEIDGLAPVRSSKQEQIHASIVSTLLALMDGMDGRGQVVVIGATNRPDSVDPALRRPGRFDREFYFPLPNVEARRAILDIHTKGWEPPLESNTKDELAKMTKGYGGADLRALCTEAALNAVQRCYPQIYSSTQKLIIDPKKITVRPKDFMISVKKMVPSSERSASSGAAPLPSNLEPLLRGPMEALKRRVGEIMPQGKKLTALEEAQFEESPSYGFDHEKLQQEFEKSRVFRPRLLVRGPSGMGQQYIAAALLSHFERIHVQSFELSVLLGDSSSSPEATMVRLFAEAKTHKPSVIYIPNVQNWYNTLGPQAISTFLGLLRTLHPTDPVMVLGILDLEHGESEDGDMIKQLFGYSKGNQFELEFPDGPARHAFFEPLMGYVRMSPADFPDPANRKKRKLEELQVAPPEPKRVKQLSNEEIKVQRKRDHLYLNMLKIALQPIMDQIRTRYRKFRAGVIDDERIAYLYEEADPNRVRSDVAPELGGGLVPFRPFEIGTDSHGVMGLVDNATKKFYYNLNSVLIEQRLSNGYYKRPKDFLADIKRLGKDARTVGDEDRILKANELLSNVEVDIYTMEHDKASLTQECEKIYQRELERKKDLDDKVRKEQELTNSMPPPPRVGNVPPLGSSEQSSNTSVGPIVLGEPIIDKTEALYGGLPKTPARPRTNGTTPEAAGNGEQEAEVADLEGDVQMSGSEPQNHSNEKSHETSTQKTHPTTTSSSFGNSAQPRPPGQWTAPSQELRHASGMSARLSQVGTFTPMAPGSQAADYHNSASTTQTSSGKKISGNTDEFRGSQDINLYRYDERSSQIEANSNLPTQTDSQLSQIRLLQPSQSGSQPAPNVVPRGRSGSISAILNDDNANLTGPQTTTTSKTSRSILQVDHDFLTQLHNQLSSRTTGCSVEQLENVNSVLMDTIWRMRGEWNRSSVAIAVGQSCNDVIEDMEKCGWEFGPSSWGRQA